MQYFKLNPGSKEKDTPGIFKQTFSYIKNNPVKSLLSFAITPGNPKTLETAGNMLNKLVMPTSMYKKNYDPMKARMDAFVPKQTDSPEMKKMKEDHYNKFKNKYGIK
jgi:hypothetical protein